MVPPGVPCQDERGRLWDIVWMTRFAILQNRDSDRVTVTLRVRQRGGLRVVRLIAVCAALDIDDPQPSITVMCPDEN